MLANGNAKLFNITEIKLIGCAVTGLDVDDLKNINLNIDIISELGKHTNWSPEQVIKYIFYAPFVDCLVSI